MIDKQTITDYNYEEKLDINYKDIPNKAFTPTKKTEQIMDNDFLATSDNFWRSYQGGKYYSVYKEGMMSGTYNARQPNFSAITQTFVESIKNILRFQCEKEDKTSEAFIHYVEILEKSFELLSEKIDSSLDERLQGELIMAYIHATFNSFISTNITKQG